MQLKQGAQIRGMRPEMAIALVVIESAFAKQGEHLVITSGTDGTHMPGSCHYKGLAVDIRLPSNPENASVLVQRLKLWLPQSEFDVVLEKDHIHVEFDPKF